MFDAIVIGAGIVQPDAFVAPGFKRGVMSDARRLAVGNHAHMQKSDGSAIAPWASPRE
jgi:hypothetical protein